MTPTDFARELLLPATTSVVFLALLMFFGLYQIALLGRNFNLALALILAAQLAIFVLPALLRALMQLLEARSKGREPGPPAIESFSWIGNGWMLFPIVHVGLIVYLYIVSRYWSLAASLSMALAYAMLLPASLMILAVTRSVLESVDPRAIVLLLRQCGFSYLLAPLFLIASVSLLVWLQTNIGLRMLTEFVGFYLLFASFAVFGGLLRPLQLQQQLHVPNIRPSRAEEFAEQQALVRGAALNHAYGLISRGNRDGGLQHLLSELATDPDPAGGWYWYFDRMLRWENNTAGLAFAQHYIHELLRDGDCVAAVKVMLRCQRVNAAFKPLREDLPEAIAAAEECRNEDLLRALQN